jgi:acyl-CoA thioester hydrolase
MFITIIEPRFSETDILGHINNTARQDIFKLVHPNLSSSDWPMIIAHIHVDFILQTEYGDKVTIKSSISKIGKKSFDVTHEAYQNQLLVAKGNAVLVWYNYAQQSSSLIPEEIRELLKQHQL